MREVNVQVWFGNRILPHVPPHFLKSSSPISSESLFWVNSRLIGRYALCSYIEESNFLLDPYQYIYFEDSKELMMYELRWSGTK